MISEDREILSSHRYDSVIRVTAQALKFLECSFGSSPNDKVVGTTKRSLLAQYPTIRLQQPIAISVS